MELTCFSLDSYKMGYKKQEWFELKRNGLKFQLTVRDQDFKRIETIKISPNNFTKTMKDIGNRYGISEDMLTPGQEVKDEIEQMKKGHLF